MVLLWGEDATHIYNDAYCALMGAKHPTVFGTPVRRGWPEGWRGPVTPEQRGDLERIRAGQKQLLGVARARTDAGEEGVADHDSVIC